jgi:hypothetical protein
MSSIRLLRASSYRDFTGVIHQGKIHLLKSDICESLLTWCGKNNLSCPGTIFQGLFNQVTCKVCLNSFETAERLKRWECEAVAHQAQREEHERQWWTAYNQYLKSSIWQAKRFRVLRRCNGICEGCGLRKATQIHHTIYPQGVMPGSVEWIRLEKLFELVGLCYQCHLDLHPAMAASDTR